MRIRTQCRECGLAFRDTLDSSTTAVACPGCDEERPLAQEGWQDGKLTSDPPGRVEVCPLCDSRHLYEQRDVNRAWGCGIVAIGAALVPWTYGLSLVVLAGVDWWLFQRLPNSTVCYRCDTVYRDAVPLPSQGEFDLLKHDVIKYGKTWDSPH